MNKQLIAEFPAVGASGGMWDNHYLIYCLEGVHRWPIGILEAQSSLHAMRRARREEWEYCVNARHNWKPGQKPVPENYWKADNKHWGRVIDIHRRRRLAPTAYPRVTAGMMEEWEWAKVLAKAEREAKNNARNAGGGPLHSQRLSTHRQSAGLQNSWIRWRCFDRD